MRETAKKSFLQEEMERLAEQAAAIAKPVNVPCPFMYAKGKRCGGHIVRVEAYKADLNWSLSPDGWTFGWGEPRSHFHLFCSEKGNHAGFGKSDNDQMKFFMRDMPDDLRKALFAKA